MHKRAPLRKYWAIPIVAIATAIGLNNLILLLDIAKYSERYAEVAEALYAPSFGVQILYAGIIIPVIEELIFRGLIFRLMRKKLSLAWAMLLSAVLFGAYHGNLVQFVYATLCGLLLAYLHETYGSVKASILAHISMNMAVCTMTEYDAFTWLFAESVRVVSVTVACVVVVGLVFCFIRKMGENSKR